MTDALGAFGMGDGLHKLGDQMVRVEGVHAFLPDSNITAGRYDVGLFLFINARLNTARTMMCVSLSLREERERLFICVFIMLFFICSVASMPLCVRRLMKAARCGHVDAFESASLRPARFLGIDDRKGTLNFGADADFIIVDDDVNVKATFIGGRLVYASSTDD